MSKTSKSKNPTPKDVLELMRYVTWDAETFGPKQASDFTVATNVRRKVDLIKNFDSFFLGYKFRRAMDIMQVLLTSLSIILWIWSTYNNDTEPIWMLIVQGCLGFFFTLDFVYNWYLDEDRARYIFRLDSLVDIATIVPLIIRLHLTIILNYRIINVTFLRFVRLTRLIRILQTEKGDVRILGIKITALERQLLVIIFTLSSLIFISTGFIHEVEGLPFHTSLYFILTTMSTVGYGDITPQTEVGRAIVMISILLAVVLIPIESNELRDILMQRSIHDGSYRSSKNHVVISGNITANSLLDFLQEFYHHDRAYLNPPNILILHPGKPSPEIASLLNDPLTQDKVFYYSGSPLVDEDLERCKANSCSAYFMISNQLCSSVDDEDKKTVLRALAIKRYNPRINTLVQVIKPSNKRFLQKFGGISLVMSINEMKLTMLAKSCVCTGATTLISNLIRSTTLDKKVAAETRGWRGEYVYGRSHEIYTIQLPMSLKGKSFSEAAMIVYNQFHSILLGVEVISPTGEGNIIMNPGDRYTVHGDEIAFVISMDLNTAQRIQRHLHSAFSIVTEDIPDSTSTPMNPPTRPIVGAVNAQIFSGSETIISQSTAEQEYFAKSHHISTFQPEHFTKDQILDALPEDISNHIIITGELSHNIFHLIRPLRSQSLLKIQDIVILSPTIPENNLWDSVAIFPRVYFVQGSALRYSDLSRAGIERAETVLVLASKENTQSGDSDAFLIDSQPIIIYMLIEAVAPHVKVLVELAIENNMKFITDESTSDKHLLGSYASGKVFTSAIFNSLVCQAFFNPYICDLVRLMLLYEIPERGENLMRQSILYLIDIPPEFKGRSFSDLFEELLMKNNMLALGLFRSKEGQKSPAPYVYTNPLANAVLHEKDQVYVLSYTNPARNPVTVSKPIVSEHFVPLE